MTSGSASELLRVTGLTSHYGRIQALHSVDLHVNGGELVALVGANGAGKTTFLRSVSGVQPISGGDIWFSGASIASRNANQRVVSGIAQVPEGRQVFAPLAIEDNLLLGGITRSSSERAETLQDVYALFPILQERRALPAGTLSGGQQQMLAIGRALMARPRLLLLDEPSMGLAPLMVEEIFRVIVRLREQGTTILLVEQNANAALAIADRGYVMETGHIVLEGTGDQLLANDKVRQAYLGV